MYNHWDAHLKGDLLKETNDNKAQIESAHLEETTPGVTFSQVYPLGVTPPRLASPENPLQSWPPR